MPSAGALVAAVIAAAVVGIVVARGGETAPQTKTTATNYNALPGIRKTKAPWPPEYQFLADRLVPLDLTTLGGHNGLVLHFHAHIDIFVNGKKVKIPALIGINPGAGYLTELHTHNDTRRDPHRGAEETRLHRRPVLRGVGGLSRRALDRRLLRDDVVPRRQAADRSIPPPSSSSRTRRSRSSSASRRPRSPRATSSRRANNQEPTVILGRPGWRNW